MGRRITKKGRWAKELKAWPTVWRTCDCGTRHEIEDWSGFPPITPDEEKICPYCRERTHAEFITALRSMRAVEDKRWWRRKKRCAA